MVVFVCRWQGVGMGDSLEDADAVGVVRKLHADAENKQIKQVDTARRLYKLLSLDIIQASLILLSHLSLLDIVPI